MNREPRDLAPVAALALTALVCSLAPASAAFAGGGACEPGWIPTYGTRPGFDLAVNAFHAHDDGTGATLWAGGRFQGQGAIRGVARWDGADWRSAGFATVHASFSIPEVRALCSFDDGTGPVLYAGGSFTGAHGAHGDNVARWDGTAWSPLGVGTSDTVWALASYDAGGGAALYVGGQFASAGGMPASGIARWDGTRWSSVAGGTDLAVRALVVHDDGSGSALYAAGRFTTAGGVPANRIARWDGTTWSTLGSGMPAVSSEVWALAVHDDGTGPALYAAGDFTDAGGAPVANVARWDGATWATLGSGLVGIPGQTPVRALASYDDGGGAALHAGGTFTTAGGAPANRIARWDGATWSPLAEGCDGEVRALAVLDDGGAQRLVVGGDFTTAGGLSVQRVAAWDGSAWSRSGTGANDPVDGVAAWDDGGGTDLYAVGRFDAIGDLAASSVARWDGASWTALGSGLTVADPFGANAYAAVPFDDGGGTDLYVGGWFDTAGGVPASNVARWDGASWSPLGTGIEGNVFLTGFVVRCMATYDEGAGDRLFVGGSFTHAGGVVASRIARWDGGAWSPVGSGANQAVRALLVHDDGGGEALFAAGDFSAIGGVAARYVARWRAGAWSALGSETTEPQHGLAVFDGGGGPVLFASGPSRVLRWNGTAWASIGSFGGSQRTCHGLVAFDDGTGPALWAAGRFTSIAGVQAPNLARWDGTSWSAVGGGVSGEASALRVLDLGDGPELHVAGTFVSAGPSGDGFLARWGCAEGDATFCIGDVASCPCGNGGAPGAGCDNAQGTGGVSLALVAQTSAPNAATLAGTGYPPASSPAAIAIRSSALDPAAPVVFGDGLRCVATSPLVRLAATTASGGTSLHAFGHLVTGGDFHYQLWYRSSPSTFCDAGAAFNLSSGVRLTW